MPTATDFGRQILNNMSHTNTAVNKEIEAERIRQDEEKEKEEAQKAQATREWWDEVEAEQKERWTWEWNLGEEVKVRKEMAEAGRPLI